MKYLVLGFFGIWVFYTYGANMSDELELVIKLFTILMFWIYVMKFWSKEL